MSSLRQKTESRLAEISSSPKYSLGQNFLVESHVVEKILPAVLRFRSPEKSDLAIADATTENPSPEYLSVIEIGPGVGALTDPLNEHFASRLTLLELDTKFAAYWRSLGFDVREGDALQMDWSFADDLRPWVLVSNLPYQISASLVIDRSLTHKPFGMVLMFQKEVGDRIRAEPRSSDYGLLSVIAQAQWQVSKVVSVSPASFWPKPKVSSVVLSFKSRPLVSLEEMPKLLWVVKTLFAQRRKQIGKVLGSFPSYRPQADIQPNMRAEELSVEQFIRIMRNCGGGGI